jgi:hypothetical protein
MPARYKANNGDYPLRLIFVIAFLSIFLSSCSTYIARSARIKQSLEDRDFNAALDNIEGIDKSRSALLYYYEKGLTLHLQDEFEASNDAFEEAEILLEELYTKSVTRELAALTVTDNMSKYRGDPFEAIFINYYKILNYLHIGDIEGALVESRKVNHKLQVIHDSGGTYYIDDPFLQYLTGMVYHTAADYTEAEVSYRTAIDAFDDLHSSYDIDIPGYLYCDAAATARSLGDLKSFRFFMSMAECPQANNTSDQGSINIFLECGYLPHKTEENIILPIFTDDDVDDDNFTNILAGRRGIPYRDGVEIEYLLRIAFPILESTPIPYDYAIIQPVLISQGKKTDKKYASVKTSLVVNFDALATRAFQEKENKILLRTIIRALSKYAAKRAASEKSEGLGIAINVFNVASESADTRNWSTLPEKILMGRLILPEGEYDLKIDFYEYNGHKSDSYKIEGVEVDSGRTLFFNYRFF